MADNGDKVNRLSKHPYPKQRTILLNEQKLLSIDLPRLRRFPCPLLASLGNWKEGGARLPRDSERLEERV